eukprot:8932952-Alexandrium_andersonii.AAC.1
MASLAGICRQLAGTDKRLRMSAIVFGLGRSDGYGKGNSNRVSMVKLVSTMPLASLMRPVR